MRTSEQTDKIEAALGRVQATLALVMRNKGVEVEGTTTKFASRYVTLAALYEACRDHLTREGITIWQGGHFEPGGGERLVTRLSHEGQSLESSFPVKAREGAQNFGGGIAFARRWGLACAVGIFPADDSDERHGYQAEKANKPAAKGRAPTGIADTLEAIRRCARLDDIESQARFARGAFPTGEAAAQLEKAIAAWYLDELRAVAGPEHGDRLLAVRASGKAVGLRAMASDITAEIRAAEARVKGAAS